MSSAAPGRAQRVVAALARAQVALAEAAALVDEGALEDFSNPAAQELTETVLRMSDTATAIGSAGIERVDRVGAVRGQGFVSTATWLIGTQRWSKRTAARAVSTARALGRDLPATRRAWLRAEINGVHVDVVATSLPKALSAVDDHSRETSRDEAEQVLVEISRHYSADHTRTAMRRLAKAADQDGATESSIAAAAASSLRLVHVGDGWRITGWLDDETGAALQTALEGKRNTAFHSGETTTATTPADDSSADTARASSYDHLNAVALGELVRDALRSGDAGSIAGERAHLDVVVTLHELRAGIGHGEIVTSSAGSLPLDIDALRRIACDADLRRVVTSGQHADPHSGRPIDPVVARLLQAPSEVLDYGRSQRLVPTGLRRRLALRDGGCVFPHCPRPPSRTEAHHVRHWADGGGTSLDNLALLCSRHHHAIHHDGWELRPRPDHEPQEPGYWQVVPCERTRTQAA